MIDNLSGRGTDGGFNIFAAADCKGARFPGVRYLNRSDAARRPFRQILRRKSGEHDDLTGSFVRLHQTVRLNDIVKPERLSDIRLD